ncbi:hypothetical protein ACFL2F_02015 [Myxococcota bacterium]
MKSTFLLVIVLFLLAGCGDDGNGNPDFECTEQNSLCARLVVPDTYTGTPLNLMGLLYATVPPAGPPGAILEQVSDPVIGVNRPYDFEITGITQTGDYHFVVNLLMVGGGTMSPVAGIDYVYWTSAPINFDGNPINLGEVELWLYE